MSGCIEARGSRTGGGYVLTVMPGYEHVKGKANRRRTSAHRAAWIKAFGPIADGLVVCHACDNPACVNLEHLWLGTVADNNRDRAAKGRSSPLAHGDNRGESNPRAILSEADVATIRDIHARDGRRQGRRSGVTRDQLALRFGVSVPTIDAILAGRNWSHLQKGGAQIQSLGRSASSGQGLA